MVSLVGVVLGGWSSDRSRERVWHTAVPLFVMALGAAVFAVGARNEALAQRDVAQGRQLRAEAQRLGAVRVRAISEQDLVTARGKAAHHRFSHPARSADDK